jgi:SOS-response transcriptional repressor LexA
MGEYSVLYANPPSAEDSVPIGVVLRDPASDRLHVRLRQDWDLLIRDEDTWYFEQLEQAIADLERDMGGKAALEMMLQGSNAVTGDEPQAVLVGSNYGAALNRLYAKQIPIPVRRFETHLPIYSLRSAAGRFLENSEIEPEGWVEIPDARGLTQGQFIARIQGTSMEPQIPDGSLAVFDTETRGGTRAGRLVLVEERTRGGAKAYTLKKYESVKRAYSEDTDVRAAIRLLPLNPEHDVIELDPEDDRYQIVAIFVRTIDQDLAEAVVDG